MTFLIWFLALTSLQGETIRLQVDSRSDWVNTGVEVSKNQGVSVQYLDGAWTVDYRSFARVDADGHVNEAELEYYPESLAKSTVLADYSACKILRTAPIGALIGAIGDKRQPFFIGNQQDICGREGRLWLRINDVPSAQTDNQGSLDIEIRTPVKNSDSLNPATGASELLWARIKTGYGNWNRHPGGDGLVIRQIGRILNCKPNLSGGMRQVSIQGLSTMCNYPFLLSAGSQRLSVDSEISNLREYLSRGGFLLIDECFNPRINPQPQEWMKREMNSLSELLPGSEFFPVRKQHEIFNVPFHFSYGLPETVFQTSPRQKARPELYMVRHQKRVVAVISTAGLQCGWTRCGSDETPNDRIRMAINIYLYAMTH